MVDKDGEGPFPHPADLYGTPEPEPAPQVALPPLLLPDFPTTGLFATPTSLGDAYRWAQAVLAFHGVTSLTFIEAQMMKAAEAMDFARYLGWQGIHAVLADFTRPPGDNDIVH